MQKTLTLKRLNPGFLFLTLSVGFLMLTEFSDFQDKSTKNNGWRFDWLISSSFAQEELLDDDLLIDDLSEGDLLLSEDDLLGGELLEDELLLDDDLLDEDFDSSSALSEDNLEETNLQLADAAGQAHLSLFAENRYPSANTCKVCHEQHYKEWSVSQHAYAQLSPIYMAMQNKINALSSGTNGDFCIRCHNQVGMNFGESPYVSNLERHPTSREGITCVVCHRVDQAYGKVSGRIALVEGDLLSPVYGPTGGAELERVLDNRHEYRVVTDAEESGRKIHTEVGHFPELQTSQFCGSCHDVNLFNGFRLEEAFSEYKNSPAAARGESCQDCHMGTEQGKVSGYAHGPAAVVGGVPTTERKLTNHFFGGPDYSVVHPGIFPHNSDAAEMATMQDWLDFDEQAGWGTDEFEDSVENNYQFPDRWRSIDDRYDARAIINSQYELLNWAEVKRVEVLRNGYLMQDVEVLKATPRGVTFAIGVKNGTDGHNVPTGFDAERLVWLEVTLTNSSGVIVFQSGDLDANGDLRDSHSSYVHNDEIEIDKYLFSLQSKFLTRNLRGGEREQVLAVNYSADVLPFVRPFTRSLMLTGQPAGARKHRQTIPPSATRKARYKVSASQLGEDRVFNLTYKLKSAAVPVNLINEISDVGFDYGMSAKQVADTLVAGHQTIWSKQQAIVVE
jgi:nitrate/TMAO reductase-like tetraheme cytochrome c subunit